jgi:hypothetical protein
MPARGRRAPGGIVEGGLGAEEDKAMAEHTAGKIRHEEHRGSHWLQCGKHQIAEVSVIERPAGGDVVEGDEAETAANARRLAACWNACRGIPTEALESGALGRLLKAAAALAGAGAASAGE